MFIDEGFNKMDHNIKVLIKCNLVKFLIMKNYLMEDHRNRGLQLLEQINSVTVHSFD